MEPLKDFLEGGWFILVDMLSSNKKRLLEGCPKPLLRLPAFRTMRAFLWPCHEVT